MSDTAATMPRRQAIGMINAAVDIVTRQSNDPLFVAGALVVFAVETYRKCGFSPAQIEDLLTAQVVEQPGGAKGSAP